MSSKVEVICDGCGKDLTQVGKMPTYRLHLTSESIPTSGAIYAVIVTPPIKADKHFCGLDCLLTWANDETKIFGG